MSSGTVAVTLLQVKNNTCIIRVRPIENLDDTDASRSFILSSLADGDFVGGDVCTYINENISYEELTDEDWLKENLDRYVVETKILEIKNSDVALDENLQREARNKGQAALNDLDTRENRDSIALENALCEIFPNYTIEVTLAGLLPVEDLRESPPIVGFLSTYDIWRDDPKSAKVDWE